MRLNVIYRYTAFLFVTAVLTLSACTRITTTDIGAGLIPAVDGVNTFDTIVSVETDSYIENDTTRIYPTDNQVLGAISRDPLFGTTLASLNFELKPGVYPFAFPGVKDSLVVDSAVLVLSYRGHFGDSTQPLRLSVNEISASTPIDPYLRYAANYPAQHPLTLLGPLADPVNIDIRRLGDSVKNRFENATNQIRIRLRSDVARRFIRDYDSTNAYKNDSTFRTYFGGFAVRADQAAPANSLLYINLSDTNTKLSLYYSTSSTGATVRDTGVVNFRFDQLTGGVFNFITRNRAGSEAAGRLNNSRSDSLVYVQTNPGTFVRIKIPALPTLNNRIVHRAELIAEQVPDDANLFGTDYFMEGPRILLLSIFDSVNNRKRNIPNDYSISASGPNIASFGGFRVAKTVPGYDRIWTYNFNLSRYVQGILSRRDTSFTLRLTAPSNDSIAFTPAYPFNTVGSQIFGLIPSFGNEVGFGRVRLGGGTHSRFRMRLRIVYSKI